MEGSAVTAVLQYAPEGATASIGFPAVSDIEPKVGQLLKRFGVVDSDARIAEFVSAHAADAGVPDAKSLADVYKGKGIKPDAPIAAFIDVAPTMTISRRSRLGPS